jgi:hypothetical protein
MTTLSSRVLAIAFASALLSGSAFAQTAAPAPAAPAASPMAPAPAAKKAEKPRTAQSLACSKQADDQSLHGKPRKKFMKTCKNDATKSGDAK